MEVRTQYDNGNICSVATYDKNQIQNGPYKFYWQDGEPYFFWNYANDLVEGEGITFEYLIYDKGRVYSNMNALINALVDEK